MVDRHTGDGEATCAWHTLWQLRSLRTLLAAWLGGIVLADYLFYRQPVGFTLALFGAVLLTVVAVRVPGRLRTAQFWTVVSGLTLLSLALVHRVSISGLVLYPVGLVALTHLRKDGQRVDAATWLKRFGDYAIRAGLRIPKDCQLILHRESRCGPSTREFRRVIRQWLVPILLTVVFVALFAMANPIIEAWLSRTVDAISNWLRVLSWPHPLRLLLWITVGALTWSLYRYRRPRTHAHPPPVPCESAVPKSLLNTGTIIRSLTLFNTAFAIQNLLDIRYLWSGAALPESMTYAQYAHRGAYPLVATALLAGAFVLVAFPKDAAQQANRPARRLVEVWIAQNIFLTLSSVWRLVLYIGVYNLTRFRLAAAVWMSLVALGLAWTCVRIVTNRTNNWLVNVNAVTLLVVLLGWALLNPNRFIATYNVHHCREGGGNGVPLDLSYLKRLGTDALPALVWLRSETPTRDYALRLEAPINDLGKRLDRQLRNWRGWTFGRWQAQQALRNVDTTRTEGARDR